MLQTVIHQLKTESSRENKFLSYPVLVHRWNDKVEINCPNSCKRVVQTEWIICEQPIINAGMVAQWMDALK